MKIRRFSENPIVRPGMDERMGDNINGPSLIRVPEWAAARLGRYYLYFAHHNGAYIRLAFADRLEGPWRIHPPGVLDLRESLFDRHVASPDVHVLDDRREIRMYYHGCCLPDPPHQATRLAVSRDGLRFRAGPEILGASYWRVFRWREHIYALEMPGRFRRSRDGRAPFEEGPLVFTPDLRHAAVQVSGHTLNVFYSNAGDCPERILRTTVDLAPDWRAWRASPPVPVLVPERAYEGADCPPAPSRRGAADRRVREVRDPCVFEEDGKTYLLYAVAGEHGIAIAEIV